MSRMLSHLIWRIRLAIFEYSFYLYKTLFGYSEYLMPKEAASE